MTAPCLSQVKFRDSEVRLNLQQVLSDTGHRGLSSRRRPPDVLSLKLATKSHKVFAPDLFLGEDDTQIKCTAVYSIFVRERERPAVDDVHSLLWSERVKWKRPLGRLHFKASEQRREHYTSSLQ